MLSGETKGNLMRLVEGTILFDEPMKNHTSFHIGGPADALFIPSGENDLKNLLRFANERNIPWTVIGNGTKLLVSDEGIDGVIIKMSDCFENVSISVPDVEVEAGCSLPKLSRMVANSGLSGLEFAVGIPGTVGGGVVMNAGAHGSMLSDVLTIATVMNANGDVRRYSKNDLDFGYRQSKLQNGKVILLNAKMKLEEDNIERIKTRMHENMEWRKKYQPLNFPNAGSIFKNPTDSSAGRLIDMAGLKGLRVGSAKISEKNANFIVNLGEATANDFLSLFCLTQKKVLRKHGVWLEPEIRIVGRFEKHVYKKKERNSLEVH